MTKRILTAICSAIRATATGAVQVLPAGPFKGRTGRPGPGKTWEVKQGPALAALLNARHAEPNAAMNFDYDHQTMLAPQNGQKALASGWARVFEWRDGAGLFAVDQAWTPVAKAHIDADEYRYVSPVINFDPDSGEVIDLQHVSLTNFPDVMQLGAVQEAVAALNALSLSSNHQENDLTLLASLLLALGLPNETTETAALTAVTALKAKADAPPKAVLPAAVATALGIAADAGETVALSAVTTLKAQSTTGDATTLQAMQALQGTVAALTAKINDGEVTALVDGALKDGKLLPAQKDWAIALGKSSLAQLSAFITNAPKVAAGLGATQSGGNGNEGQGGDGALTTAEIAMCSALGLTHEQFKAAKPAAA